MKLWLFLVVALVLGPLHAAPVPDYPGAGGIQPLAGNDADDDDEAADTLDAWLVAGEQALDQGRYKSARTELRKVLKEQPAHQAAARGLADALAAESDYREAARTLERVLAAAGDKSESATWARLGRTRLILGDYAGVTACADALFKLDADDIDGVLLSGRVLHDAGRYDEAAKVFLRVRQIAPANAPRAWRVEKGKRNPRVADLWSSAGECYFMLNLLHNANEAWGLALDADAWHMRTLAHMARLYLEQNHESSALVNYVGEGLRVNPQAADLHYWAAQAHFSQWRGGQGLKALEQCLKIAPDHYLALAYRAQRFISTDDYDAGRRDYERALKLNPRNIEALGAKALHGATLGLAGVYDEAEKAALSVNAKPARFYEIVADGLSERFRYHEALPLYDKAIACHGAHWTAWRGAGMAAMNKGDDVLGKKMLETAHKNDPLRNNKQTLNLLTLLDSYKNFERYESPDGRWRLLVHKSEARVMRDIYLEHLEEAWARLEKKYDFKPRIPLTIEA
ncbi:MAG: tetratricopeptide repeat protein, partial [Planctomycetes bacterium]|nr:tetratricopeptide repeat protein [Planctomycetota bacterium]